MNRNEFKQAVLAIAEGHVRERGEEPTPENVQKQALWLAAMHEATGISEAWTLQDIATALMSGGIPATSFEEWVDACTDEDGDAEEALDLLRLC